MKRWLISGFISTYLSILGIGIVCHTLSVGLSSTTGMYYIVWDMFCGWAAYGSHPHVIGEGESGKFYELAPGPWGDVYPFGRAGRQDYDPFLNHVHKIAQNTLRHTDHEPMVRVFIIEEVWSKKYNMPDYLWDRFYPDTPKVPRKYYRLRAELSGDAEPLRFHTNWFQHQWLMTVTDNPKVQRVARDQQNFFVVEQDLGNSNRYFQKISSERFNPLQAPLGN